MVELQQHAFRQQRVDQRWRLLSCQPLACGWCEASMTSGHDLMHANHLVDSVWVGRMLGW